MLVTQTKLPACVREFCKRIGFDECAVINEDLNCERKKEGALHEIGHFKRGDVGKDDDASELEKIKEVIMKKLLLVLVAVSVLFVGCAPKITQEQYDAVVQEKNSYASQVTDLQSDVDALQAEKSTLQADLDAMTTEKEEAEAERDALQLTVDSASDWFALSEEEQADMLTVLAERAAAREAEAAKEAQVGYKTGITYDQLARTPDDYTGKKVMFKGRVLQVLEGSGSVTLRVATRGNYDDVLLVDYESSIVTVRVLEDDWITIYGVSNGLYTYESTGGADITIPYVTADQIEIL